MRDSAPFSRSLSTSKGSDEDDSGANEKRTWSPWTHQDEKMSRDRTDKTSSGTIADTPVVDAAAVTEAYRKPKDVRLPIHIMGLGSVGKLIAHSLRSVFAYGSITLITHRPYTFVRWRESARTITLTRDGATTSMKGFSMEVGKQQVRSHGKVVSEGKGPGYRPEPPSEDMQDGSDDATPQWVRSDGDAAGVEKEAATFAVQASPDDVQAIYETPDGKARGLGRSKQYKISNLILCVKASDTVSALLSIKNRLDQNSTITFVHNGMGIIDAVNESVFPDETTRPEYLLGVISHGAKADGLFSVEHTGQGTLAIGPYPDVTLSAKSPSDIAPAKVSDNARYIMQMLAAVPVLTCATFPVETLLGLQLEKLAINAVVNPLTSLMDCRNGALTYDYSTARMSRLILAEVSVVLRNLPALKHHPTTPHKFSPQRLENLWVTVAHKTRHNVSSMLADVRRGRKTEIDYINGWVVKMGEVLGVTCVLNYSVVQMIKAKTQIVQRELKDVAVPWEENMGVAVEPKRGTRDRGDQEPNIRSKFGEPKL